MVAIAVGVLVGVGTGTAAPGDLMLVSVSSSGTKASFGGRSVDVSEDGTKVLFWTDSSLDPADAGGRDLYLRDTVAGTTTLVTTNSAGQKQNGTIELGALSADGTKVAFSTTATNLDPGDLDSGWDVYVKDLISGQVALVSTSSLGVKATTTATFGLFFSGIDISGDGSTVAFVSNATNMGAATSCRVVGPNINVCDSHLFVKRLGTGVVTVADSSTSGQLADKESYEPSLSRTGDVVAFRSSASNLDPLATTQYVNRAYVKNIVTGELMLASISTTGEIGSAAAMPMQSLSADGTKVAFETADILDPQDTSVYTDVYIRDLPSGETKVVTNLSLYTIGWASLAGDGSAVAFYTDEALVPADSDTLSDVYVVDVATGALELATETAGGVKSNGTSFDPSLNGDGSVVVFTTIATNLDGRDTESSYYDVYRKELRGAGPVDANPADGIVDSLQPPGTPAGSFTDGVTAGTVGVIPAGYTVAVTDLAEPPAGPGGVHVVVAGSGTEKVTVALTDPVTGASCGTVRLLPGSDVELACGSIVVRVANGSPDVEIVLSDDTSVFVAANQAAELAISAGSFTVLDVAGAGGGTLRLVSGGTQTQVGEGMTVALYDFVGFSQPVDNGGVFNVAKGGSTIPLKWRLLTEAGVPVTNLISASVGVATADCSLGTALDDIELFAASPSGLQNLGNGYYQLNWKTPKTTGCRVMALSQAGEGPITHTALFKFK